MQTQEYRYREVPPAEVDEVRRDIITDVAAIAARDLGLGPIRVRFYDDRIAKAGPTSVVFTKDADVWGFVLADTEDEVWVRTDLDGKQLVRTTAHEVKHLQHLQKYRRSGGFDWARFDLEYPWREEDATLYAERVAAHLGH